MIFAFFVFLFGVEGLVFRRSERGQMVRAVLCLIALLLLPIYFVLQVLLRTGA